MDRNTVQLQVIRLRNFRSIADSTFRLGAYSLLVGRNNAGKSNIMDALRILYEKDLKYDRVRDWPKFATTEQESWIDVEFVLTASEYAALKAEYQLVGQRLRLRKYFSTDRKGGDGKPCLGVYAHLDECGTLAPELFYGAKNVQQGKLGDLTYIPAVSRLDEHTKMSGPSVLRDLVGDLFQDLAKPGSAFAQFSAQFQTFVAEVQKERTPGAKSFEGLVDEINANLGDWGTAFELKMTPPTPADIVKGFVSFGIVDNALDAPIDAARFGQGFQRHLIFTLIRMAANYKTSVVSTSTAKDFQPRLHLLLFEEPEAFLHPTQQTVLARSLRAIAHQDAHQVLATSHSPSFVSHNARDIPSIICLGRDRHYAAHTVAGQVTSDEFDTICSDNQALHDIVAGTTLAADHDDLKLDMESIKYFLWLDSQRCGMFFAQHVLLVEGPTERVLIDYLLDSGQLAMPLGGVFVLDCLGKFNMHRFMNILGPLRISHSVLFDGDGGVPPHDGVRKLIEDSMNPYTQGVTCFPLDLEEALGIAKPRRANRKPQNVMLKLHEDAIAPEKLQSFIELVTNLITSSDSVSTPSSVMH